MRKFLIFLLLMSFTALISATEINSPNYSGYFNPGSLAGNITGTNYNGSSSSFYQAGGYINGTSYTNNYGFIASSLLPQINITTIKNKTYINRKNLPLNFTSQNNPVHIWYNIDSSSNITLTGNTSLNVTSGAHTIYLFANNSYGINQKNISFFVDPTILIINFSNYAGNGSSTNFNSSSYDDIQNISGIILEKSNKGKIVFNQAINVTNDMVPGDGEVDINSHINISSNLIEINTTALPNFNVSATLSLEGLTFTNPRILKDGVICPSSICTEISYAGGTFVFNVTTFSSYTTEETPTQDSSSAPAPSGGSGGGATGAAFSLSLFTVNKDQISVSLNPGQIKKEDIRITNVGSQQTQISLKNLFTDFILEEEEDVIILNPQESKTIPLYIIAKTDTAPELYIGRIILSSGSIEKEVLIAVEVEEPGILLDVRAEIQREQKKILAGEAIVAEIRLFNLGGDSERKDIFIEYIVRDSNNKEVTKETESLAIETQASFVKRIYIPREVPLGNYILYVKVAYGEGIASASDNFEIVSSKVTSREKLYIVIIVILGVILSLIFYLTIVNRKNREEKKKSLTIRNKRIDLRSIMKK